MLDAISASLTFPIDFHRFAKRIYDGGYVHVIKYSAHSDFEVDIKISFDVIHN